MKEPLSRDNLYGRVLDALRAWSSTRGEEDEMLSDLLLVREERDRMSQKARPIVRLATNRILYQGMEDLANHDKLSSEILMARFADGMQVLETALRFGLNEDQFKRRQRQAIQQLTDVVIAAENRMRTERLALWQSGLPSLPQETFGLEAELPELINRLIGSADGGLVVVNGIGGIGKTHLALVAAHQLLRTFLFEGVSWVRIEPTPTQDELALENHVDTILHQVGRQLVTDDPPAPLPPAQLVNRLKSSPLLIVIDNVEFSGELDALLDKIQPLVAPSKFIFTSRVRASVRHPIYHLTLGELNRSAARSLILNQAAHLGIDALQDPNSPWIDQLLDYLGGHPQALRLVISLATVLPLAEILVDFKATDSSEVQNLYRHIYRQSWNLLSPNAQEVLESLTMCGAEGMGLSQLQAMVDLSRADLLNGIAELARRSLVDVLGTAEGRRYAIHRLTEAFLKSDIIHWPEENVQ